MKEFWNERFSSEEYIYGTEPNQFLKMNLDKIEQKGDILFLADGEGRNSVYAAKTGWNVTAMDYSEKAKIKALKLADKSNVTIDYQISDIREFSPNKKFDVVAYSFFHLPEELRKATHKKMIDLLKPNGKIIIEAYSQEQMKYDSGGPKNIEVLYTLEQFVEDFQDLEFLYFAQDIDELKESDFHRGKASLIRFYGTL